MNLKLQSTRQFSDDGNERIERSIAYMMKNTNRPLRLSTLAAMVKVSPSRYFELFKQLGLLRKNGQ